jgi:hypothetical protein
VPGKASRASIIDRRPENEWKRMKLPVKPDIPGYPRVICLLASESDGASSEICVMELSQSLGSQG